MRDRNEGRELPGRGSGQVSALHAEHEKESCARVCGSISG